MYILNLTIISPLSEELLVLFLVVGILLFYYGLVFKAERSQGHIRNGVDVPRSVLLRSHRYTMVALE